MDLFAKKRTREEFSLDGIRKLELCGFNGSIRWLPVEGAGPCIIVEKEARALNSAMVDELLGELRVENTISQGKLVLKVAKPTRSSGFASAQVSFKVQASPDQIEEFSAQTTNGTISLAVDFKGKLDLTTANGRIELQSCQGQVNATTSNGRISFGKLILEESSALRTSNGRIEGQAEFLGDGHYLFETSNGSLELRIPHASAGSFRATTSNGKVTFAVGENQASGGRQFFIERSTGPSVRLVTSNGNISVLGY